MTGEPLHEAVEGIGHPKADVRILCAMYSTPGMFVTRGDSAARRIADLKGQSVAFGAKGSGLVILARYALDGLGLDLDRDFKAVYLEKAGDGPAMVEDSRRGPLGRRPGMARLHRRVGSRLGERASSRRTPRRRSASLPSTACSSR